MSEDWDGLLKFIIMGQPVSKKNQMQMARTKSGRLFPVPSARYRKWLSDAKKQVPHVYYPIEAPIHLEILAYRHTMRNIDLSNIYEAVQDMLQHLGIIKDDGQVQSHDGSRKHLGVPEDGARVEITIRRFKEDKP